MLWWMAWFWWCSGEGELADSAQALALQLSDEQYAVPAHPFTTALITRSLMAAQAAALGDHSDEGTTGPVDNIQ